MKLTYSLILAAAASGLAFGQTTAYTTPVGYETITLAPGTYNLTGVRLFNTPVAAGTFESFTTTSLTDDQATFSLDAGTSYIVEFPSGATITALGSDFATTTLSNLTGIDATYVGAYVVRKALTVASVFGAANEAGLASTANAAASEADIVWIPAGSGAYVRAFYSTYADDPAYFGWLDADTYLQIPNQVIDPQNGVFVQTQASVDPIVMTITGEVKKTPTAFVASDSFSLVGGMYPAGATLTTSGLSLYVQGSANAAASEADVVWFPAGGGAYVRAFYSTYPDDPAYFGWLNADTYLQIPDEPMTPGFFIQKIGPTINGMNTPPAFYSGF